MGQVKEIQVEAAEAEWGRRGLSWLVWLLVATLIYVLSVGPAERLSHGGPVPTWALVIYAPLGFACAQCAPTRKAYEWHVYDVWGAQRIWITL